MRRPPIAWSRAPPSPTRPAGASDHTIPLSGRYKYGSELERGTYGNNAVEYSFVLFCGVIIETIAGYMLSLQVLSFATVHMILYLWARNNPTQQISLMGVIQLQVRGPAVPAPHPSG